MLTIEAKLVDADWVAEMCSVSPNSVRRWAQRGLIPAVRLPGGTLRFRLADVQRIAEPRVVEPTTAA